MIKVLVVDDSAFMRKLVSDILNSSPDLSVVDTARNGLEAIDKIKQKQPDVVTMDVEMPGMDGLSALKLIMEQSPTPVVMLSSLTKDGADATLKALEYGAVDFVAKPGGSISTLTGVKEDLIHKVRAAAKANLRAAMKLAISRLSQTAPQPALHLAKPSPGEEKVVAIGTSTGGPRALQEVLTKIPAGFPCGILVVQHMPPKFTKSLADRLNAMSALEIKEAETGDVIRPGLALIAPGDYHMRVERLGSSRVQVKLSQDSLVNGHRPAVDPMFFSVAQAYKKNTVGVILTGMGYDGAAGIKAIKEHGGYAIAEDPATAVIYGMPRSAIETGMVDKVVPLSLVASTIISNATK